MNFNDNLEKMDISIRSEDDFNYGSLNDIALFNNGKSSPERNDKFKYPVFGANGLIGFSENYNAENNTIIIGRVGSYCGNVYYSKYKCWVTDNAIIGRNNKNSDPKFLYYLLKNKKLNQYRSGSGQPLINQQTLYSIKIHIPSLEDQKNIGNILSSLDDKIELNNRMNKTLEEIGQTLFKEWFIDFEFPDEEGNPYKSSGGEMVESELGLIPEGWEVKKLPEIIEIDPLYKLIKNTIAPYVEMKNIPTSSVRVTDFIYRAFTSGSRFKNGDVVFARITPCLENGKTAYIDFLEENQIGWGSTEFIIFSAKHYLPKEYVYFLARNNDFRNYAIKNMSGTSGRQRVPNKCFEDYKVILSDEKTLKLFEKIIGGIFKVIKRNDDEANILKNIRDTLLSKLMSGEIRVKDIS